MLFKRLSGADQASMSKYVDLEPILQISNIRKVCEYDETGEYITYLAVPLEVLEKAVEHMEFEII